jgi:hypothetical protein
MSDRETNPWIFFTLFFFVIALLLITVSILGDK